MILLISALLGLILGLLAGGSLKAIAHYPLKGALLPVAAYLLKIGAGKLLQPQTGALAVCLLQYALVFTFLLIHHERSIWPLVVFLGSLLNLAVIAANNGCMPVSAALFGNSADRLSQLAGNQIYAYCLADESTRLRFLGDVIRIGPAGVPIGFASIGDCILCLGVLILVFSMTRAKGNTVVIRSDGSSSE